MNLMSLSVRTAWIEMYWRKTHFLWFLVAVRKDSVD